MCCRAVRSTSAGSTSYATHSSRRYLPDFRGPSRTTQSGPTHSGTYGCLKLRVTLKPWTNTSIARSTLIDDARRQVVVIEPIVVSSAQFNRPRVRRRTWDRGGVSTAGPSARAAPRRVGDAGPAGAALARWPGRGLGRAH